MSPISDAGQTVCAEVSMDEANEFDAGVDGADGTQGELIYNYENVIPRDSYQHSELMRSRRCLRLKRVAAQAKGDRLGILSNVGSRVSKLVIHIGPKGKEARE